MNLRKNNTGIRCSYHNYENGQCTHCGKKINLTSQEAAQSILRDGTSRLILIRRTRKK